MTALMSEIDSSTLPAITKFSYLKELLEPKVCNEIDGLPFTTEGYAHAKNILKTNHENTSKIVRAYITNIQELPTITGRKINMIHEFIKTLNYNVQSLETLGKLSQCLSMVRGILEKLPGIKAELVANQVGWQDWGFTELLGALENWKAIHPLESSSASKTPYNLLLQRVSRPTVMMNITDLMNARLLHLLSGDKSCKPKNYVSIVLVPDTIPPSVEAGSPVFTARRNIIHLFLRPLRNHLTGQNTLIATHEENKVCHPIVIVKANNVTCRALLDTGATTSYASAYLLSLMKLSPSSSFTCCIETITSGL